MSVFYLDYQEDQFEQQNTNQNVNQNVNQQKNQQIDQQKNQQIDQHLIQNTNYNANQMINQNFRKNSSSSHNSSTNSLDQTGASKNSRVGNLLSKIRKPTKSTKDQIKDCLKCNEFKDQIIILNDDNQAYKNEIYGNKEVIKVLQRQLEEITIEKESNEKIFKRLIEDKKESLDINELMKKECEIEQLKFKIKNLENELNNLKDENKKLKFNLNKLKEENNVLEEMLKVKDQTVMNLTNEIYGLEKGEQSINRNTSFNSYLTVNSFPSNEIYVKPSLPNLDENEKEKLKGKKKLFYFY